MKTLLKHRIDRLYEQAVAGNSDAQLKLAKEFVRGRLVEKSQDNARYWAFKAITSGNLSAISFYGSIASDHTSLLSENIDHILSYAKWIPWIEMIGAMALLLILPFDKTISSILGWFVVIGMVSLFLYSIMSKILKRLFGLSIIKGIALVIFVLHGIALIFAYL